MSRVRIFISHSSKDREIASALTDLLRAAFPLDPKEILCTSVEGAGMRVGENVSDVLCTEATACDAFIGLLTRQSLESAYVLFELGARWGAKRPLFPVLARGAGPEVLDGPLRNLHALRACNEAEVWQLVSDVAHVLRMEPHPPVTYRRHIDTLLSTDLACSKTEVKEVIERRFIVPLRAFHQEMEMEVDFDKGAIEQFARLARRSSNAFTESLSMVEQELPKRMRGIFSRIQTLAKHFEVEVTRRLEKDTVGKAHFLSIKQLVSDIIDDFGQVTEESREWRDWIHEVALTGDAHALCIGSRNLHCGLLLASDLDNSKIDEAIRALESAIHRVRAHAGEKDVSTYVENVERRLNMMRVFQKSYLKHLFEP